MQIEDAQALVAGVSHWHHRFEVFPGVTTPGSYDPQPLWDWIALDKTMVGRSLLDIGCSDGFFTKSAAGLGATVTAVDFREKHQHGFAVMETLSARSFAYEHVNVLDIEPGRLGRFDVVLFLGVLYHLPDMVKALSLVRALCSRTVFVETHCEVEYGHEVALARYHKASTLGGDITNYWSPNRRCLLDMLYDAGFDVVRDELLPHHRLIVEARITDEPARLLKGKIAYGLTA